MDLKNFLDKNATLIIQKMDVEFDSHEFIQQLLKDYEKDYVIFLNMYINSDGIFRTFHANIGTYLVKNHARFDIFPGNKKVMSDNIKDYKSLNQKWIKK